MIVATSLFNHPNIKGVVEFSEKGNKVVIKGTLKSNKFKNSTHGIHIHEAGDLSDNCMGACGHFNPYGKKHGGPGSKEMILVIYVSTRKVSPSLVWKMI